MARSEFTVSEGSLDTTQSVASAKVTADTIETSDGNTLKGASGVKDNSLAIVIQTTLGGTVTFKAGEYHNKVQGDYSITVDASSTYVVKLERLSRFLKKDGSIDIDFTTTTGTIFAVGKHAGLAAV